MKLVVFLLIFMLEDISLGKSAQVMFLRSEEVAKISLSLERATVLSFPSKPEKIICGNKNQFSVEFIENDVLITPLTVGARSNLFVYLLGRRFGFNLEVTTGQSDEIVIIRDAFYRKNKKSEFNFRKKKDH